MKFQRIAKLVRKRREKLNLSQTELGTAIGVHTQVISNIERGIAGVPSFRAAKFAKALQIPVKTLVGTVCKDYETSYMKQL